MRTNSPAHVYDKPDSYSEVIDTLPADTEVVVDEVSGTGWVHLVHDGYIPAQDIDLDPDD